jgi:predicted DNA-binding transcriptional regulator AlpA
MQESNGGQVSFGWIEGGEGSEKVSAPAPAKAPRKSRVALARVAKATNVAKASEEELPAENELWDVHAAARFLKRSVSWVYHKAEDGTLPVRRLGGWGIRFIPGELRAWVQSGGPVKCRQ